MRDTEPARGPSRAIAGAVAVGVLAVAALLSGPIFGPSAANPSARLPSPTPAAATATPDRWAELRRPLRLPSLGLDGSCPTTGIVLRSADLAPLPWPGNVVPLGAFRDGSLYYDSESARWDSLSLVWVAEGRATDALVRGGSLEGTRAVGFGDGLDPLGEMRLDGGDAEPLVPGWAIFHSDSVRVQQPGCYALQIDTATDSSLVVFDARHTEDAVAELLERPIKPLVAPEDDCSRIEHREVAPNASNAVGPGPAYMGWSGGPIKLSATPAQDVWRLVLTSAWFVDARERGPVIVRSATGAAIRFDGTSADRATLALPVGSFIQAPGDLPGWRSFFAEVWVSEPGCYVLQVDSLTASYAFAAFEATP